MNPKLKFISGIRQMGLTAQAAAQNDTDLHGYQPSCEEQA